MIKAACSTDAYGTVGARNQNAKLPIRHICAPFVVEPLFMCAGALYSEEARGEVSCIRRKGEKGVRVVVAGGRGGEGSAQ